MSIKIKTQNQTQHTIGVEIFTPEGYKRMHLSPESRPRGRRSLVLGVASRRRGAVSFRRYAF